METNNTKEEVKEEIESNHDHILQSRIDDIKTDPQFKYKQ